MVALQSALASLQGSETHSGLAHAIPPSETHNSSNGSSTITVPDARLLFGGDYKQSGLDLILSKDGHDFTIHEYFRGARHADLTSPDGARLNAGIVDALTAGHTQYAQATGAPEPAKVIGQVSKLTGSATAIRNGVAVELNAGDNVMKGDVVQAGAGSQVTMTFVDGTVFGLSSNARMVLNEMIYDPNGSSNSSLLSLVQGTISFVAGETARHGDMRVDTPVATMGIRGTAAVFELGFEVTGPNARPMRVEMIVEPGAVVGSIVMLDKITGQQIGPAFNQKGLDYIINAAGNVTTQTAASLSPETKAIVDVVMGQYFGGAYNPNPDAANPKTDNPTHGSTPATPPGPAGSPGDNHTNNDTTTTPQPTILHIDVKPGDGGPTRSLDLVIDNPPKITVVNVVDKSFAIADQVTIVDPDPDTKTPYMSGSATLGAIVTNAKYLPPGLDFSTLIHIDKDTGKVTYDAKDFAFLGVDDHVTYTINFNSASGPVVVPESVTLTIDGTNDQPIISGVDHADVTERTALTGSILSDVATGTLTVSDADLEDTHSVANKLISAVWSNGTIVPAKTLADLVTALQSKIQGDTHGGQATLAWNFSLPDHDLDFLAKGEKLTVQYQLVVTDSSGAPNSTSAPETLTLTLFANNDQPVLQAETAPQLQSPTTIFTLPSSDTPDGKFFAGGFDLAGNPDGTFTAVWADSEASGASFVTKVHLRDVDPTGAAIGATKTLSFTTSMLQVDDNGAGNLGVVYLDGNTLRFQVFDQSGHALSSAKAIFTNPFGPGSSHTGSFPADGIDVTHNPDGSFTAFWLFDDTIGNATTVHVHSVTISADGSQIGATNDLGLGNAITELQADTNDLGQTALAYLDGNTLKLEVLDASGKPIAAPTIVFDNTKGGTFPNGGLDVVHRNDGSFAIAWSFDDSQGAHHTYVQSFSATGVPVSSQVDLHLSGPFQLGIDGAGDVGVIYPNGQNLVFDAVGFPPLTYGVTELVHTTNAATSDIVSGFIPFADTDLDDIHTVASTLMASVWSGGSAIPSATLADLAAAFHPSVVGEDKTGFAAVAWNFSVADLDLDFLAKDETVTLQYQVVVTDDSGAPNASSAPLTVTITLTGTNDVPVITSSLQSGAVSEDADGSPNENAETHHQSGAVTFTDVDLRDVEKSSITNTVVIATLANGYALTQGQHDALVNAFSVDAATHSNADGTGSFGWHYDIADSALDFLGVHDQVVLQYTVQVDDHNGGTAQQLVTITVHGSEDAPVITSTAQSAVVTEDADLSPNENKETHTQSGAVTFTDADLSDKPTGSITHTVVTSTLANGYVLTQGERDALVNAFTIDAAAFDAATGAGSIGWHYAIADSTLDFLGKNDQVALTYTVQVDDHNGGVETQDVLVTVHGSEDAPVITSLPQSATVASSAPPSPGGAARTTNGTITFSDADLSDKPTSSIVVADTTVTAKLASGHQLTQAQHDSLVNAFTIDPATFNAANGTGSIGWHYNVPSALSFLGSHDQVVLRYTVQVDDHSGGVTTQDVVIAINGGNVSADVAPVIDTTGFTLSHSGASTTIKGLVVSDADTSAGELYGLTAHADSGSVVPGTDSDGLGQINSLLSSGVTYTSPATPPETDKVTMTVTDGFNKFATVNFIFQEGTPLGNHVTLDGTGTVGKDVIFASGYDDTMIGNGQGDQFVFQNGPAVGNSGNGHDVITNFAPGTDKIDLRFYSGTPDAGALATWLQQHATSANNGADTLLDLDQNQTGADTVLLKNVALANLHASDFIVHS